MTNDTETGHESFPSQLNNLVTKLTGYWRPAFGVLAALGAVFLIWGYPVWLREQATFVSSHLPLSLPILMVAVSIGVRAHELSTSRGWLGLCNHFSAGYVTFAIWALVSGESVRHYIWINDAKVLDKSYSVPLVITAFGLLAVCSLVTALATTQSNDGNKRGWKIVQSMLVVISLFALLFPYVLFENKADVEKRTGQSLEVRSFTVSITYRDSAYNQYLGRSTNPMQQSIIFRNVAAKTPDEAKHTAKKSFLESEESNQYQNAADKQKERPTVKVEIESAWIVAEADTDRSDHR